MYSNSTDIARDKADTALAAIRALKKDAERYLWLKRNGYYSNMFPARFQVGQFASVVFHETLDDAIDAELAKEKS
jgi:hypothetical protein